MKILSLFILCIAAFLTLSGCQSAKQAAPEEGTPQEKPNNNLYLAAETKQSLDKTEAAESKPIIPPEPISSELNEKKDHNMLDLPLIKQNPELKFGCEVTSLAMVLNYAGVETDKMKLADELPKDSDPIIKMKSGDITHWGNPDHGFVGDISGNTAGYAVYAGPLEQLMNRHLPNRTVNLTEKSIDDLLAQIDNGKPVIVWTTGDFKAPDRWESWLHNEEKITTPLDLHVVVLVGYDQEHVYVNDPLTGEKNRKVNRASFLESWEALGKQALSYN